MVIPNVTASDLCMYDVWLPGAPYVEMNGKVMRVRSRASWTSTERVAVILLDEATGGIEKYELPKSQSLLFTSKDVIEFVKRDGAYAWETYDLMPAPQMFPPLQAGFGAMNYTPVAWTTAASSATISFRTSTPLVTNEIIEANAAPSSPITITQRRAEINRQRADARLLTRDRWGNGR